MNFIEVYDNALDVDTCDMIIDRAEGHKKIEESKHQIVGGSERDFSLVMNIYRTGGQYEKTGDDGSLIPWMQPFNDPIRQTINKYYNLYSKKYNINKSFDDNYIDMWKVQKTYPGSVGCGWHDDHEGTSVHSSHRWLVWILYLNDHENGELIFQNYDEVIYPKAGRLVIFPTSFTHRHMATAIPSDKYPKYIVTSWFCKFKDEVDAVLDKTAGFQGRLK